jgi:hypothetical protein
LFRRNLHEPEVITFDELVARAEWHVEAATSAAEAEPEACAGWARAADPWQGSADPW